MLGIAVALFIITIVQLEVHKCDAEIGACVQDVWFRTGERLKCTCELSFLCLNYTKSDKERVVYLVLENGGVDNIYSTAFQGLDNLARLSLIHNTLDNIEGSTFIHLRRVEYMHLEHNSIKQIDTYAFQKLTKLTFIDLENNQLITIASGTFTNLPNIMQVFLSRNNIEEIHADSFSKNSPLKHLHCSENKIKNLAFLKNLPMLAFLDLSHNRIEEIPACTLLQMKKLLQLNLSYNKLKVLNSGVLSELQSLQKLNLSNNRLKHLGEGAFDRVFKLKDLSLKNNYLKDFSYRRGFEKRNGSYLYIHIDNNYWSCNFIHHLLQLNIKLYHEVRKNVSNVEGIACIDEMKYIEQAKTITTDQFQRNVADATITPTSTYTTSTPAQTATTEDTISSDADTVPSATPPRKITNIKITTRTAQKFSAISRQLTAKEIPPAGTAANTVTEESVAYVRMPEIKINLSLLVIGGIAGLLLIVPIIVILSIRFTNCRNSTYPSDHDLTKDGYMRPRPVPQPTSNFYVTLDAYNQYEEIDKDVFDHVYEVVE